MSNTNAGTQQAIVLWLSGVEFRDIRALPEIEALLKQGAMVELEPSPITEPLLQHYQTLSGRLPEHFGFFDTLVPRNYAVVEESSGRGVTPKLLPDLLRTVASSAPYSVALRAAILPRRYVLRKQALVRMAYWRCSQTRTRSS